MEINNTGLPIIKSFARFAGNLDYDLVE